MHRTRIGKAVASLSLLALLGICTYGQQSSNKPTTPAQGKPEKAGAGQSRSKEENPDFLMAKRLAQGRLETVAERAKRLDPSIMKVKILSKVADAMWTFDETNARALFVSSFRAIETIKLDSKQDQRFAVAERRGGTFGPLFHLRNFILQLVVRHDFKLADNLRKSMEKENEHDEQSKDKAAHREEQNHIYLDMAVALAEKQPEQAAQVVRAFWRDEIDQSLVYGLIRMRGVNAALADELFREALISASVHQMLPNEFGALASYVLPKEDDLFFGIDPSQDPSRIPTIRLFLDFVYSGATGLVTTNTPGKGIGIDAEEAEATYYTLKTLLPMFERLQPDRTSSVREQMGELLKFMKPVDANNAESTSKEAIDDLVRMAESAIGERRRTLGLIRASGVALKQGEVERALDIAQRIDDLHERKIQTSLVLYQTAMRQLRDGRLERAYAYAKRIEFLPQRVAIFQRMAQKSWKEKEPERARSILEELWDWLEKTDNTPQKADSMLKITATMAQRDKERAFEFLRSTARVLDNTDFTFKGFDQNAISVELQIAPDMLDLDSSFITLARSDPERAQVIAQSLNKPELSLLAQAIVCQQVLTPR